MFEVWKWRSSRHYFYMLGVSLFLHPLTREMKFEGREGSQATVGSSGQTAFWTLFFAPPSPATLSSFARCARAWRANANASERNDHILTTRMALGAAPPGPGRGKWLSKREVFALRLLLSQNSPKETSIHSSRHQLCSVPSHLFRPTIVIAALSSPVNDDDHVEPTYTRMWYLKLEDFTGWPNRILDRKLKYSVCCLIELFLFLVWHLSKSIWTTSISGVKSSCTTLSLYFCLCIVCGVKGLKADTNSAEQKFLIRNFAGGVGSLFLAIWQLWHKSRTSLSLSLWIVKKFRCCVGFSVRAPATRRRPTNQRPSGVWRAARCRVRVWDRLSAAVGNLQIQLEKCAVLDRVGNQVWIEKKAGASVT